MHKIYQFSKKFGGGEFLVISDLPQAEIVEEWGEGYDLDAAFDIEEDATRLPCDRALTHD